MTDAATVIVGNGRSGTNWVMEMFNASPSTFCRNEPQEIGTSPLQPLLDDAILDDPESLRRHWSGFLQHSRTHCGERDTRTLVKKDYHHGWIYRTGLVDLLTRRRVGTLLKRVHPTLAAEWPLPLWVGSRHRLSHAYLVLKINDLPAWLFDQLVEQDDLRFIHVLRHPGGQAHSAFKRHFSRLSQSELEVETEVYRRRLSMLLRHDPRYEYVRPHLNTSDPWKLSMWFWKINNEVIWRRGSGAPGGSYKPVVYESMVTAPKQTAASLFEHARIPLEPETSRLIDERRGISVWGKLEHAPKTLAEKWKTELPPDIIEFIQTEILASSPLRRFWKE